MQFMGDSIKQDMTQTQYICTDCGNILTNEERYYYETRCDSCEWAWSDRMTKWMQGGEDEELDKLYDAPKPVVH